MKLRHISGMGEENKLKEWVKDQLRNGEDPKLLKTALSNHNSDPEMVDEIVQRLRIISHIESHRSGK